MIAISIALPVLVIFAILVGWFGGGLVSAFNEEIGLISRPTSTIFESVVDFRGHPQRLDQKLCFRRRDRDRFLPPGIA